MKSSPSPSSSFKVWPTNPYVYVYNILALAFLPPCLVHIATAASQPASQPRSWFFIFSFLIFSFRITTFSLSRFSFSHSKKWRQERERLRRVRFFPFFFWLPQSSPLLFFFFPALNWNGAAPENVYTTRAWKEKRRKKKKSPPLAPFKGSLEIGFLWPFFSFFP